MDSENEPQTANGLILLCAAGGFILMETLHCTNVESAIGPLFLAASGRGLVALEFDARLPGQQTIRPNPRHRCVFDRQGVLRAEPPISDLLTVTQGNLLLAAI